MYLFKREQLSREAFKDVAENVPNDPKFIDILLYILPALAFAIWWFSLHLINVRQMNDLGLVSVMPPSLIAALVLINVSFCLLLRQKKMRTTQLLLHFGLLIFMLYGITNLVEEMPRFSIVYRHNGYTEYIMRTGTVDPGIDAYFSWPVFFAFTAFLTKIAGYTDILSFAAWAPVYYNIFYAGPLYIIFYSFTKNKSLIWLSMWFFYLTNWIGQDYFSPQGFNFFLYLVIIGLLLTWFKQPSDAAIRPLPSWLKKIPLLDAVYQWLRAPDPLNRRGPLQQERMLIGCILIIFAFIVSSHQLTPFFTILSVGGLALARRCRLWWLPIIMLIMTFSWIFIVAQPFLVGHMEQVFGGFGRIFNSFSSNVSDRVAGNPEHTLIARLRIVTSMVVWGSAFIGSYLRWRKGYNDATIIVLALSPFPLFMTQPYGGEMLLRSYMFALAPMCFLMASIFFTLPIINKNTVRAVVSAAMCILLVSGFLFTRYGNESMDYVTRNEYDGVDYLYTVAPDKSLLLDAWGGVPWKLRKFEKYKLEAASGEPILADAIEAQDIEPIAIFMREHQLKGAKAYIIFTRSQKQKFDALSGIPVGTLDLIVAKLKQSSEFKLLYNNPDAQIFQLVDETQAQKTGGPQP